MFSRHERAMLAETKRLPWVWTTSPTKMPPGILYPFTMCEIPGYWAFVAAHLAYYEERKQWHLTFSGLCAEDCTDWWLDVSPAPPRHARAKQEANRILRAHVESAVAAKSSGGRVDKIRVNRSNRESR